MSWSGVLSTVNGILVTAGASTSMSAANRIKLVRAGEPRAVNVPTLAYWWTGDRESGTGGNTFGKTNIEEGLAIGAYWPVSDRQDSITDVLETDIRTLKQAITAGLWGDATLGGNCIAITLDPVSGGWWERDGRVARSLLMQFWVDLAEVDSIAP